MKKLLILLSFFFTFQTLTFGQQEAKTNDGKIVLLFDNNTWIYADSIPLYFINPSIISLLEIPQTSAKDKIITHTGYSLLYNEKHEQAQWVAYELTKEETVRKYDRTDKFVVDPLVKTGTANNKDYAGSGYDRGHLAPAADMGWSSITMSESFYYSNMSPQDASFNRGIWKKLEGLVRNWAVENNVLYLVTGPVLKDGLPTIGNNKVSVPKYFYKVILDYSKPDIKGIGFILPNAGSTEPIESFAVSIDSVESITGIDFFPLLPDDEEQLIEKTLSLNSWTWSVTIANETNEKVSTSMQCKGIAKSTGQRCKNKTLNENGYCHLHQDQVPDVINTIKKSATPKTTNSSSKTILTGPRGGKYYINSSGKKTYIKK